MTLLDKAKRPYRKGVGAVLINADGLVFVARRIDTPGEAWQLPQGGIDKNESPEQAVLRELEEETGIGTAEIITRTESWLSYDLPDDLADRVWKGRYRGQRQVWFALRFTGIDEDVDLNAHDHPEFDDWKWVPLESLPKTIISFKKPLYEDIVDAFRHLIPGGNEPGIEAG